MGTIPERGSLAEHPLPRLLVELSQERFDGSLTLVRQRVEKRVVFKSGSPVLAESNVNSESLSAQLVEDGGLDRAQQIRVDQLVAQRKCPEGAALLALKFIEPLELFNALQQQLRRRIWACFDWRDGEFSIESGAELPPNAEALRCDPLRLTLDGLVRHWGTERLAGELGARLGLFPVRTRTFDSLARELPDDDLVRGGVAALDGTRNLGQALGASATQPNLLAAVWLLDATGAIEFRDAPKSDGSSSIDADIEIDVTGEAANPDPRSRSAAGPSAGADGSQDGTLSAEAQALHDEIHEMHGRLSDITHYAILGVEEGATAGPIKKAYFTAAKRFHPDTLARLGLGRIKATAGEVFARISEAYEALRDADRRANYDARLAGGGDEIDANRIAQAETFFVKAHFLMKMGNFREAHPLLESAVELWPDEAEYQSNLGWALYKKAPSEPLRALEHLGNAIAMKPDDSEAEFRLNLIKRSLEKSS